MLQDLAGGLDKGMAVWHWNDPVDLVDGSVIRPHRVEKGLSNNHCAGEISDHEEINEVNTATSLRIRGSQLLPGDEDDDVFAGLQQSIKASFDDGRSSYSLQHLQSTATHRLPWVPPIRLHMAELYWVWVDRHFDLLKAQLGTQGFGGGAGQAGHLFGWFFRNARQSVGAPFSWGMSEGRPWSLQINDLMRGARLADSLLYTVVPHPSQRDEQNQGHLFLMTPLEAVHRSVLQECPTRVFYKSVPQECPTRVSCKSVPQECPTRVTHKSVLQE